MWASVEGSESCSSGAGMTMENKVSGAAGMQAEKSGWSGQVEPFGVPLRMPGDFLQHRRGRRGRLPAPDAPGLGGIEHDRGNVERPRGAVLHDLVRAEALGAPVAQLLERHGRRGATRKIHDPVAHRDFRRRQLFFKQGLEVARVQAVADLVTVSAEAEVFQRALPQPRVDPLSQDPLLAAPYLTDAGDHPP